MTKELRELLAQIEAKKTEVRALMGENKVTEAETAMNEVRSMQKKADIQRQLDETEANEQRTGRPVGERRDEEAGEAEYREAFFAAFRRRRLTVEQENLLSQRFNEVSEKRAMTEGSAPDGGLIVPQDIVTRIKELQRSLPDLSRLITVEPVTTLTGSRVLEKGATYTPWPEITEMVNMTEENTPQFVGVNYAVKSRGGILPVSSSLLSDSDQNIIAYLSKWASKKQIATRNGLILALLAAIAPTALADLKALNKVLNVTLDPAISATAVIVTNQDGFDWLDNQADGMGRPILTTDLTQPTRKLYKGRPIEVISNKVMATADGKAPVVIGNLQEFAVMFDRSTFEIMATNVGGDAFRRNSTDVRVITREDLQKFDGEAAIYGQLTI